VEERETYRVKIGALTRHLPLFEVGPNVRIALFNLLGDSEVVQAAAAALAPGLAEIEPDVLVTAETKSIPLAYQLALELEKPWVVLRKAYKPYMGSALSYETNSITTGATQTLYLDEKDRMLVRGKRVAIVDDVISTGSTLQAMRSLMDQAGAETVACAAVFIEGDGSGAEDALALGRLPLFAGD
jgi:adenine/guanine phosphoribosyltransferase-like PRPP-binding protein